MFCIRMLKDGHALELYECFHFQNEIETDKNAGYIDESKSFVQS